MSKARPAFTACLLFGGLVTIATAQQVAVGEASEQPKATSDAALVPARVSARAVEVMLARRVDSVDWTDKTFEEVLDWLKDQGESHVNILPRWIPLGVENVTRESLVNLRLNNTTVAEVLDEVFDQLSEDSEVRFRGEANKLTISTKQDFERKLQLRVYDATDILFRVPDFGRGAPQIDLQKAGQNRGGGGAGGGGGGGGGQQGVFGGGSGSGQSQNDQESGEQAEQRLEQRLEKLRTVIQLTIAPETWDTVGQTGQGAQTAGRAGGGGKGRIEIHNRSMIITNTIEVHELIAGMFSHGG